ncbi:MAG: DUF58 domain-containing protein, partial [Pseudomonadota bacterium]
MAESSSLLQRLSRQLPIVPTERAAWMMAAFAPVAVVIAALAPGLWVIAPLLALLLIGLILVDGALAGRVSEWAVAAPGDTEVGQATDISVAARFARGSIRQATAAIALDPRLGFEGRAILPLAPAAAASSYAGALSLTPERRGTAPISHAWLRWTGPMGLGARQSDKSLDQEVRIWPDLSPVRSK